MDAVIQGMSMMLDPFNLGLILVGVLDWRARWCVARAVVADGDFLAHPVFNHAGADPGNRHDGSALLCRHVRRFHYSHPDKRAGCARRPLPRHSTAIPWHNAAKPAARSGLPHLAASLAASSVWSFFSLPRRRSPRSLSASRRQNISHSRSLPSPCWPRSAANHLCVT